MIWPQIWNFTFNLPRELFTFPLEKMIMLSVVFTIVGHYLKKYLISTPIGPCLTAALDRRFIMLKNMNLRRGHTSKPAKLGSLFSELSLLIQPQSSIILDAAFSCWIDQNNH
jgi:hypothetical protein